VFGDVIEVAGATAGSLNTIHTITGAPTANTFDTNVFYVVSGTSGTFSKQLGTFDKMTAGEYLGTHISKSTLAGLPNTALVHNGGVGNHNGIHRSIEAQRIDEQSWDYLTHAVTKGANAGVVYEYHPAQGSGIVETESQSVYVWTGSLTVMHDDNTPVTTYYPAKTG
jgi:hypothetical protein